MKNVSGRSRWISLAIVIACFLPAGSVAAADPYITQMAGEVSQTNVESIIQTLQDFGTRYTPTAECDLAADWVHSEMVGWGLNVSFDNFTAAGWPTRNVVARLEGVVTPDTVFIIGAHYDSIVSSSGDPMVDAPGADDDASGVAAVLEAARIMSQYQFENTVEFIAFGGEEQGRKGSEYNAGQAAGQGKNIAGVINLDMIGYWPPSSDMEMDIGKNASSGWLADVVEQAALDYSAVLVHNWPDTGVCFDDHVEYWAQGYDAIVLMDCYEGHADPGGSGEGTPHYHRTTDTIDTLDLGYTTEAVRAAVAATAVLAVPVIPLGACCEGGGGCSDVGDLACADLGGEWQGEGTDCAADPCAAPCQASNLVSLGNTLMAVKGGVAQLDIDLSWQAPGDASTQCNVNYVDNKGEVGAAHRDVLGMEACAASVPLLACTHSGGITAVDDDLYYQAFSACGDLGADEGPF